MNFASQFDFKQAQMNELYGGIDSIEAKLAGKCLKNQVILNSISECELSEVCTFANDKIAGVTGLCLKQSVGVDQSAPKFYYRLSSPDK